MDAAALNAGITGRDGAPPLLGEALEHRPLLSVGGKAKVGSGDAAWKRGPSLLPGPGSSLHLSCSWGWIIPAWHAGLFYFPCEKESLYLKYL